jgi:oxidoreductase GFO/IDH/MOCA family
LKELRLCFVGIGSIAKRHIRNLQRIAKEDGVLFHIDAVRRSGQKDEDEVFRYIDHVYTDVSLLNKNYDAIFITNPTEKHLETLQVLEGRGESFFIEKPLVSIHQLKLAMEYTVNRNKIYYVACPLRYNAVIQYIKKNINPKEVISVRSISSSFLPDWRPGQDYRQSYSAKKSLGGGVSIDLIHEWDYLSYLFGTPQKVNYMGGKKSTLEIDSDDYAIYIAEYEDKILELHLDYFGRSIMREITLFTEQDTIMGDIAKNKISFLKEGRIIDFHEERDDYQLRELRHFLSICEGKVENENSISKAISTLRLTQGLV